MKIVVISLQASVQRRRNIAQQFDDAGLAFEFFDAIPGARASRHVHHYDEAEFRINNGRSATSNEIGCYASHLAVWRHCVDAGQPVLILEDDARLSQHFVEGLAAIGGVIERCGIVRASLPPIKRSTEVERLPGFRVRYCHHVPLLALGYALSPAAAARLIDAGTVVDDPVDKFLQRFWIHGQPTFALRPYIVHLDPLSRDSDIGGRERDPLTPGLYLRRRLRRTGNSLRREWFNARFLTRRALAEIRRYAATDAARQSAKISSPSSINSSSMVNAGRKRMTLPLTPHDNNTRPLS